MSQWNYGTQENSTVLKVWKWVLSILPPSSRALIGTEYCIEVVINGAAFRERGKYRRYEIFFRVLNNCLSRCALTRRTARIFIHFQLLWTWAVPVWVIAQAHASYWVTMSLSPVTIVATHSKHMPGILGRLTHGKLLGTGNTMSLGGPRACHWPSDCSWTELNIF